MAVLESSGHHLLVVIVKDFKYIVFNVSDDNWVRPGTFKTYINYAKHQNEMERKHVML
jgi:hypothetical protein